MKYHVFNMVDCEEACTAIISAENKESAAELLYKSFSSFERSRCHISLHGETYNDFAPTYYYVCELPDINMVESKVIFKTVEDD